MIVPKKNSFSLLIALMLCFTLGGTSLAADNNVNMVIAPQWVNTDVVNISLSFSGSKGSCGACVLGKTGTTKITGTAVLSRKNSNGTYITVKTWRGLAASGSKLIFDATYYVTTGYTYRLTFTAMVYRNGTAETVKGYYEVFSR